MFTEIISQSYLKIHGKTSESLWFTQLYLVFHIESLCIKSTKMGLESTMICVDTSDFMRNGDFVPTRLQAQQDAVNVVSHSKTRSNPENNVGLLTLSALEVLSTLTTDAGRLLAKLHQVQPKGEVKFVSGIRIAHLALKHRQGKNHKMRIVVFIASPIQEDEKELVKLAKKLKKEKVMCDVVNFGEENATANTAKLTTFINTLNGKDGTGCNLVTVSSGALLSDALVHSPIIAGEDGSGAPPAGMAGFEFGVDPNIDPELALALRVSMEEQRARQEKSEQDVVKTSAMEASTTPGADSNEEAMLAQALRISQQPAGEDESADDQGGSDDLSMMTEEQQIEYALRLSMQASAEPEGESAMETEGSSKDTAEEKEEDVSDMVNDPEFLQSVLEGLPGVDPSSEAIRTAMGQLTQTPRDTKDKEKDKEGGSK